MSLVSNSTDSVLKFPLAVSCFAAQRFLDVLPMSDWTPVRAARKSLYEAGESAKKGFSTNTMMFGAFQFGDKAQSALAALATDAMSMKMLSPSYMRDAATSIAQGTADAYDAVTSAHARSLLKEQFQNTGDVISYVNHVDAPTELSADGTYPLADRVADCYSRGDYPALWLVEGLGERYAHAWLAADPNLTGLFTKGEGTTLPEKTLLMMHAGAGITFAKHEIDALTPWSADADVRSALARFVDLCRRNSIPGYECAALESLGLVTRTWYPQLVSLITSHLLAVDANAVEFFWHGAGRAMYFSPMYMLPGLSPWDAADQEPPDDTARLNARAGVAWAFTIVNVRQPGIAEQFLRLKASRVRGNGGYTNGLCSALIMASDMVPGHQYVKEFCEFAPNAAETSLANAWERHIGHDLQTRIDDYRRMLKAHHQLGEVFRYHPLPQFVGDLEL